MISVLFKNAAVITMDGQRRVLQNGAVAVEGDRIAAVGDSDTLERRYGAQAGRVIDCRGNILMPGLINCHTHAGHNLLGKLSSDSLRFWGDAANQVYEHRSDEAFWEADGALAACKFLRYGVTTAFHILGCSPMSDAPANAAAHVRGYSGSGLREVLGCGIVVGDFPHAYTRREDGQWVEKQVSMEDMAAGTEEILKENHRSYDGRCRVFVTQFLQLADHNGQNDPVSLARLTERDRKAARLSRELAGKYQTMLCADTYGGWIKLAAQDKEHALLGPDVLLGLEHQMGITPEEVGILSETGTRVYCTGEGFYKRAPVSEMIQKGIPVAATTNGCAPRNMVDLFEAVRKLMFVEITAHDDYHYLQAAKALEMITIDAAKCLGWEDEIGSLETGKKADIIMIDWNAPHLAPQVSPVQKVAYYAVGSDVCTVMVDGTLLMEDRRLLAVDEKQVLERADAIHSTLVRELELDDLNNRVTWGGKSRIEIAPDDPVLNRLEYKR